MQYTRIGVSLEVFRGKTLFPVLKHVEHPVIALALHYKSKLVSIFFSAFFCFFEPLLPSKINLLSVFPELCFPLGTFTGI